MEERRRRRRFRAMLRLTVFVVIAGLLLSAGTFFVVYEALSTEAEVYAEPNNSLKGIERLCEVDISPIVSNACTEISLRANTSEKACTKPCKEVIILAKLVYGEASVFSITEQAAVIWCVLNRVDAGYGDIISVVTAPHQFVGYRETNPVCDEYVWLAEDVLYRWQNGGSGRVLPSEYLYFHGDGKRNHFRSEFKSTDYWDWSLPSPYKEGCYE